MDGRRGGRGGLCISSTSDAGSCSSISAHLAAPSRNPLHLPLPLSLPSSSVICTPTICTRAPVAGVLLAFV